MNESESVEVVPTVTFADLGIHPKVLKAVTDVGYETPSAIQAATIPPLLAGADVVGLAQTGTGKTAAYTLPLLNRLLLEGNEDNVIKSVIIVPTRELAQQIDDEFRRFSKGMKLYSVLLVGGVNIGPQFRDYSAARMW